MYAIRSYYGSRMRCLVRRSAFGGSAASARARASASSRTASRATSARITSYNVCYTKLLRAEIGFSEWLDYAQASGMRFRTRPPGVVEGAVGAGTLNLPVPCARARARNNFV